MDSTSEEKTLERSGPVLRDEYDGVKFRTLAPGITTHPLIRRGRPCIVGTGLKVSNIVVQQNFWQHGRPRKSQSISTSLFRKSTTP